MATVVVRFEDAANGQIDVRLDADPPLPRDQAKMTPAQFAATDALLTVMNNAVQAQVVGTEHEPERPDPTESET